MLLTQFYKRMLRNEGANEEDDDIFRPVHALAREKVSRAIRKRPEVAEAIDALFDLHIDNRMSIDKIG